MSTIRKRLLTTGGEVMKARRAGAEVQFAHNYLAANTLVILSWAHRGTGC